MKLKKEKNKQMLRRIIENALKTEEALTALLRIEIRMIKIQMKDEIHKEEIQAISRIIRHIIFQLTVLDDRIQKYFDKLYDTYDE